jgi:hypothetical protein
MSSASPSPCDACLAGATRFEPCSHPTATLAAAILGSSLAFIDGSVVNVALPALDRDLALYTRVGAGAGGYWTEVLPATLTVAVGMAICVAPLTTTVVGSVDPDHVGAASGFNSAVARIGGLIATALLGFVFAQQASRAALLSSAHGAALAGAATAAVAGACALVLIRTPAKEAAHG